MTVVGARPQFVKAAVVSPALRAEGVEETLVHTGQHYDWEMSAAFFEGLCLPSPGVNLGVGSGSHGAQTGRMLEGIERAIIARRPKLVIVYGDTNSTLAASLAAAKLDVPVGHVEAGLRSFDRRMPEEVNRVITDHISTLLFAPTPTAVMNLAREGIDKGVKLSGDVMFDLVEKVRDTAEVQMPGILSKLGLERDRFALLTVHRAENTNNRVRWAGIVEGITRIARKGVPILWPAHPRIAGLASALGIRGVHVVKPLPYLEMQMLVRAARVVMTDSGGLQKEAAAHGTPCVTLRDRTEWIELLDIGANVLAGVDPDRIVDAAESATPVDTDKVAELYGGGVAGNRIAVHVRSFLEGPGRGPDDLNGRVEGGCEDDWRMKRG